MDPEHQRFKRKHPKFPGVQVYVQELRRHNVKGAYLESLMGDLIDHAPDHIDEIVATFKEETDIWVQRLLLSVIAETCVPLALPLFKEMLKSSDWRLRSWSIHGLKKLNTKEARQALWEARSYTFATSEETQEFLQELEAG
jgi:hypothetical protein